MAATTAIQAWATANGVSISGDWDTQDAHGVANVFRYVFDRVDDAFSRLARNPATPRGVLMRLIKLDHRHLEEVLQNQGFDLMSLLANR